MLFKREGRGRSASFRIVNGVSLAGHGFLARARWCSRRAVKAEGGSRPALLDLVLEAPVGADAGGDRADLQPLTHAPEHAGGDLRQQSAGEDVVDVAGAGVDLRASGRRRVAPPGVVIKPGHLVGTAGP